MTVSQFKNYLTTTRDYRQFLATQQEQFVCRPDDFREEADDFIINGEKQTGDTMPWPKTHTQIRFRPSEVTVWAGARGHFKSMVTGMVAAHLMKTAPTLIASLEMKPALTLARMCRQVCGVHGPTPETRDRFWKLANDVLWIYDQHGEVDTESALGLVTYAADHLGCRHIFWDSLMMAGMGLEDYDAHRAFVQSLADIAKHSGAHIHLVAHLRKGSGPEYHPNANDIKGASEIGNLVSNIILVWANKPKFHSRSKGETVNVTDPDLRLIVDKQRNGSFEGHIGLFLHQTCLQFMERPMADAVLEML